MSQSFEAQFYHRVLAVYDDYRKESESGSSGLSRDLNAGLHAAKALYHLRESVPPPYSKLWQEVASACADYGLLRDVVDADKHSLLANQTRAVSKASQIREVIVSTEYQDEQGPYCHVEKRVWLYLTGGSTRDLMEVLTNVINYWFDELHSHGLLSRPYTHYDPVLAPKPIPREKANRGNINLQAIQGLQATYEFAERRFNYDTGRIEPVNLRAAKYEFRVFKPEYQLDMVLKNYHTGVQVTRTITISQEEHDHHETLSTPEDKQAYLHSLPQVCAVVAAIVGEESAQKTFEAQ